MSVKKIINKIDRDFMGGVLNRYYSLFVMLKKVSFESEYFNYGFVVQYQKSNQSLLNNLSDRYGSDKGEVSPDLNPYAWPSHNYADFYNLVFGLRRNDVKSVVECGLGTNNPDLKSSMGVSGKPGASLRMWRDYFPNANIVGCDIDKDILFSEERIKTFHCDQTSDESVERFLDNAEILEESVDVIIDDGLHEYFAGICFFENMISSLRGDGIYIIEDATHKDVIKYKNYFMEHSDAFEARFVYLKTPFRKWRGDNNLICITRKTIV